MLSSCTRDGGFNLLADRLQSFSATGSEEGELKIWDLKSKSVLQTHKAHHSAINVAQFSPDGQWLITGAEEGSAKVWALAANAMLTELQSRACFTGYQCCLVLTLQFVESAVTCIDFHPKQLVFAIGTQDGSVRFWSLEVRAVHRFLAQCLTFSPGEA